ncbi:MAG: hypothetical protein HYY17_15710 [Planctomycetes bacterium]|nr:hypothetical protein [Planctomycetota bacterium]
MSRPAAWLWMVAIVVAIAVADFFILTSSATLSRLAREELKRSFGDDLSCGDVRVSIGDRTVLLEDVSFTATPARLRVLSAKRAEIRMTGSTSPKPELVVLESPRLFLSDELFTELGNLPPGPPLRERIGPEGLPRIECRGGVLEFAHREFLHWDSPQAFAIRELALSPLGRYRYILAGRLSNPLFGEWRVHGEFDLETETTRLHFECDEIVLGPKTRHVLSPSIHPDWDRYKPDGPAAVSVEYVKQSGRDADFRITLRLKGMGLTYKGFPYPVERVEGEIDFFTKGFQIKYLQARRGPTLIRFDGRAGGYAAEADFRFRLDITDMPLDATLRAALDAGGRKIWDQFNPGGWIDATGWIVRDYGPDKPVRNPLSIRFKDTSIVFRDFPYPVSRLEGEIEIDSPDVRIKGIESSQGRLRIAPFLGAIPERSRLIVHGTVGEITDDPVLDLQIHAFDLPLDARLRDALDDETKKVWDDFRPQGTMDLEWRVTKERGGKPVHRGAARLRRCRALYREVPLWASDLTGEVLYETGRVELRHVEGTCADARVALNGAVTDEETDLRIRTVGLRLEPDVRRAMPKQVREILDTLKLEGTVSVDMQLTAPRGGKGGDTKVLVAVKMPRGRIDAAVKLDDIEQATANFEVFVGERGTELRGPVRIDRVRVEGKEVTDLSCSLVKTGPDLRFVHIQGTGYGGTVAGSLRLDTESKELGGEFTVDRLDLYEYTSDSESVRKKGRDPLVGKATLELRDLRGKGGDAKSITGTGKLVITEAKLFPVPAVALIMSLNLSAWGAEKVISAATIHFDIKDGRFEVRSLAMQGAGVAIVGKGSIDFDGRLDLKLKMQSGGLLGIDFILFQIPMRILDLLRDSVFGIHVTGTLDEPKIGP